MFPCHTLIPSLNSRLPRDCANLLPTKEQQYCNTTNSYSSSPAVVSQPQLTAPTIYHPNSKAAHIVEEEEEEAEQQYQALYPLEEESGDDDCDDEGKENEMPMRVNMTAHCETVFESQEEDGNNGGCFICRFKLKPN